MSYSILRTTHASDCESILEETNAFIEFAYTEANAVARRAHIYEYNTDLEAFAFPIHCPGSPETNHLPGFHLEDLPEQLTELARSAAISLGLTRGRMLFNVSRYRENGTPLPAHYDGELFDFTIVPEVGNTVRSGIRPSEVALLTLRNETEKCGTTLHDADGKVIDTFAQPGELLRFDNTVYQHSVPGTGERPSSTDSPNAQRQRQSQATGRSDASGEQPRWIRYTIGWRALEEGFYWSDGEPLRPIQLEEAIELHDDFLAHQWADLLAEDLSRARFPFPTDYV